MIDIKGFYEVALASSLITWIMFAICWTGPTTDNDQVKAERNDFVNVKPV